MVRVTTSSQVFSLAKRAISSPALVHRLTADRHAEGDAGERVLERAAEQLFADHVGPAGQDAERLGLGFRLASLAPTRVA